MEYNSIILSKNKIHMGNIIYYIIIIYYCFIIFIKKKDFKIIIVDKFP